MSVIAGSLQGKNRPRLGSGPASQSEHLCRTNGGLSDKGTARSCRATGKVRIRIRFPRRSGLVPPRPYLSELSVCNITTSSADVKMPWPALYGLHRTGVTFCEKGILPCGVILRSSAHRRTETHLRASPPPRIRAPRHEGLRAGTRAYTRRRIRECVHS